MVRRFNLGDVLLVRRLQGQGVCFDLETALLWAPAPLSMALLECLSLNQGRCSTFVETNPPPDRLARGFVQAWDRADGLACDVVFISPSLDGSPATAHLWHDLLEHLSLVKGDFGLQRIFAKVSEDTGAREIFRQIGFTAYARQAVFRLERLPSSSGPPEGLLLRPLEERDALGLQRLHSSITPRPVQQAEGGAQGARDLDRLLPWWKAREVREYILADDGEIQAHLCIVIGEQGYWLRIVLRPAVSDQVDRVLSEALLMLSAYPERPVYCGVREYEAGLQGGLEELGFETVTSELLMVKHITVRAKVPVDKLSPAFEKGVETAAPISRSDSCENAL